MKKSEVIQKLKDHIKGCKENARKYRKDKLWSAGADLESRKDGFEIALEYVKQIKDLK